MRFQANLRPGPVRSPSPAAADFRIIASVCADRAAAAAASQVPTHIEGPDAPDAASAAAIAISPMSTPPIPETWVKDAERCIVSRM